MYFCRIWWFAKSALLTFTSENNLRFHVTDTLQYWFFRNVLINFLYINKFASIYPIFKFWLCFFIFREHIWLIENTKTWIISSCKDSFFENIAEKVEILMEIYACVCIWVEINIYTACIYMSIWIYHCRHIILNLLV